MTADWSEIVITSISSTKLMRSTGMEIDKRSPQISLFRYLDNWTGHMRRMQELRLTEMLIN
jgi:hypothetical protein